MMHCYIVTLDGNVLGVFSSEEKAIAWIQEEPSLTRGERAECDIEDWEMDAHA